MKKRILPWWTWILPLLVLHIGTEVSVHVKIAPISELWYLPLPLAFVMVRFWGPRVIAAVFVNAAVSSPLWGIQPWHMYPVYALPETAAVALSYYLPLLFSGKRFVFDSLRTTSIYLITGLLFPVTLKSILSHLAVHLTTTTSVAIIFSQIRSEAISSFLASMAITAPLLLFATDTMDRKNLAIHPAITNIPQRAYSRITILTIISLFAFVVIAPQIIRVERIWWIFAIFLFIIPIKFGFRTCSLANIWSMFLLLFVYPLSNTLNITNL